MKVKRPENPSAKSWKLPSPQACLFPLSQDVLQPDDGSVNLAPDNVRIASCVGNNGRPLQQGQEMLGTGLGGRQWHDTLELMRHMRLNFKKQ